MKQQEKKSLKEEILDDLFNTLKEKDEFDDKLIKSLTTLGISNRLSHQESVEKLIDPKEQKV